MLFTPLFPAAPSAFQLWKHVGLERDHARRPRPWYALQRLWRRRFNSRARVVGHGVFDGDFEILIVKPPQSTHDVTLDVEHSSGVDGWVD